MKSSSDVEADQECELNEESLEGKAVVIVLLRKKIELEVQIMTPRNDVFYCDRLK